LFDGLAGQPSPQVKAMISSVVLFTVALPRILSMSC
jgi:hypothetical protein